MQKQESQKMKQAWVRLKETLGMTMVEILVVVAIISILGGVTGVAVWRYQRSLAQLERDGIAKEIFVAAQNHLTAVKGEGYLGKSGYGTLGTTDADVVKVEGASPKTKKVYYYTVDGGQSVDGQDAFNLMLPFGSIDETVRTGGHYIIRYQPDTATVLDVFYWSKTGSPSVFNYQYGEGYDKDYQNVVALRDVEGKNNKAARRTFAAGGNSVLGWYGGADATKLPTLTLLPPIITVVNGDRLYVTVKDTNYHKNNSGAMLQLIVEGKSSGAKKAFQLKNGSIDLDYVKWNEPDKTYTVVLDDITNSGKHFCELTADTGTFIPGEDITVQAVAYSTSVLANIATSDAKTTNSLFADSTTTTQALIASMRHLENLDKKLSNLDGHDTDENYIQISSAVQINDLDWAPYFSDKSVRYSEQTGMNGTAYQAANSTSIGQYYPISPDYALTYDGNNHSISNVTASGTNAGLFGSVTTVSSISNLELLDFTITGTTSAGALAGTLTNCDVTNVLARNKPGKAATMIQSTSGSAGGLIGVHNRGSERGSVSYSAAAMVVNGSANAGGLIGEYTNADNSVDTKEIIGCYSGGHTSDGSYKSWVEAHKYDVIGATAGGLIGSAGSATISSSYSTCSVSGTTAAGGFVGYAGGIITDCYCTGLVSPEKDSENKVINNAFIGSGTPATGSTRNQYLKTVNEVLEKDSNENITAITYKGPGAEGITPIDADTNRYNTFVGASSAWAPATAYDTPLMHHYGGKYNLKSVNTLSGGSGINSSFFVSTHYGDWPSPEVFFENTPKPQTP